MNDEILPPHPGMVNLNAPLNPPPLIGPPPQPRRVVKKAARNDLRVEIGIGNPNKKKTPTPPTPTTMIHNYRPPQPGLVPLDQPLINPVQYNMPSYPQPMPYYPQPQSAPPRVVTIGPRDQTPPATPVRGDRDRGGERVVYIAPGPIREHHHRRHTISYVPVRRYHSTHRRHHSPAPRGGDRNNNRRQREARHDRDRSNEDRANAIEAEIIRLRGELDRSRIERDQARRTAAREEVLRRLDRRIQELNDDVDRQVRARRLARSPVVHDYRDYDYRDDYDDDRGRGARAYGGYRTDRDRARSGSRSRNVHFADDNPVRGRRIEAGASRDDAYPFRTTRGRSVSEIGRRWNAPRGRGERVVYEDERRRPRGGGGWF